MIKHKRDSKDLSLKVKYIPSYALSHNNVTLTFELKCLGVVCHPASDGALQLREV